MVDYSHYFLAIVAISIGLAFSLIRDIASGRNAKAIVRVSRALGNFILGWGAFWLARHQNLTIELSGFIAASTASFGMNIFVMLLYIIILIIETKAEIDVPEKFKKWIDDLS